MITRPIFSFAQLTNPTWEIKTTGWVKTVWTSWPSASTRPLIDSTGWTNNVALYSYTDGYRELNLQGIQRKYINPFNKSLLDTNSIIHYSVFTQMLDIPMDANSYTNYLATGVFIDSHSWQRCDSEYSGEVSSEECWKARAYKYSVSSGKSFVEQKYIVFSKILTTTQGEAPVFPYNSPRWNLRDVKNI